MTVNHPLSRVLSNIAKVYLITCSQSTCAKLKKYKFCPEGHGGIAHIIISIVLSYHTKYKYACFVLTFMGYSLIVGLHRTQNHVLHPSKDLQ